MLERVDIRNFQSLHRVSLELSPFTLVIGRSSTGKSALTRALRTLTSNTRGTAFITHGERTAVISAQTERGTVTLSRGGTDSYVIHPADGETQTFTKLGGAVPEEVSEFVGIPAKDPLNYANQFDMPYLLTASAAEVARTLGDLTNVSTIFEAAREANRRRLAASTTLRTRTADMEEISTRIDAYRPLKAQLAAQAAAEESLARAEEIRQAAHEITEELEGIDQASSVIKNLPAPVELPDISALREAGEEIRLLRQLIDEIDSATSVNKNLPEAHELPDISQLRDTATSVVQLGEILRSATDAARQYRESHEAVQTATSVLTEAHTAYQAALVEAGECPTCHQSTKGLTHVAH